MGSRTEQQRASAVRRRLVGLDVAAAHADVSTKTIRRRIADGTIAGYRVGRLVKVDLNDLDRLVRPIPTVRGGGAVA